MQLHVFLLVFECCKPSGVQQCLNKKSLLEYKCFSQESVPDIHIKDIHLVTGHQVAGAWSPCDARRGFSLWETLGEFKQLQKRPVVTSGVDRVDRIKPFELWKKLQPDSINSQGESTTMTAPVATQSFFFFVEIFAPWLPGEIWSNLSKILQNGLVQPAANDQFWEFERNSNLQVKRLLLGRDWDGFPTVWLGDFSLIGTKRATKKPGRAS